MLREQNQFNRLKLLLTPHARQTLHALQPAPKIMHRCEETKTNVRNMQQNIQDNMQNMKLNYYACCSLNMYNMTIKIYVRQKTCVLYIFFCNCINLHIGLHIGLHVHIACKLFFTFCISKLYSKGLLILTGFAYTSTSFAAASTNRVGHRSIAAAAGAEAPSCPRQRLGRPRWWPWPARLCTAALRRAYHDGSLLGFDSGCLVL